MIKNSGTTEGISDHTGLYVQVKATKPTLGKKTIRYRNYKNYSVKNFIAELEHALNNSELHTLIKEEKAHEATALWTKVFSETANKHAPIIEKLITSKTQKVPWYNKTLETLIEERS